MNYTALTTAIHTYTESQETAFVANDDLIIELAEKKIYRAADLNVARKYATSTITVADPFVTLPTDVVVIRSVQLIDTLTNPGTTTREFLLQKDPSFMDDFTGDRTDSGTPRYYAHYNDTTVMVAPNPDQAYTLEIAYTYRPAQIASGNTTTWLGDNAPDVLLYGCLLEASRFLKEEPDIFQMYEKSYAEAFQGLVMEENLRNRTDSYREREIKLSPGG